MRGQTILFGIFCWMLLISKISASVLYVNLNSTNPVAPFTDWNTAATNIQDAVDVANDGDQIFVTNGVYNSSARLSSDGTTNCVVITNAITLQSINGPSETIIHGGNTNRCVYLADGAILSGFTLTRGNAYSGGGLRGSGNSLAINCLIISNSALAGGGGALLATLTNCTLAKNTTPNSGGAAWSSTLINCIITNNTGGDGGGVNNCILKNCLISENIGGSGGGASYSTLYNCTVVANSSSTLGAANMCTLVNSIIYYNNCKFYGDYYQSRLTNCCTPYASVNNSIGNPPAFVDSVNGDYRLQIGSPCIDAGNNAYVTAVTDFDGDARVFNGTVDIGAYESEYTNFVGLHYVNNSSTNPVTPYTNWITAAKNIQDAIAVAQPGETVLVASANYTNGGFIVFGQAKNRVVITNAIIVQGLGDVVGDKCIGTGNLGRYPHPLRVCRQQRNLERIHYYEWLRIHRR